HSKPSDDLPRDRAPVSLRGHVCSLRQAPHRDGVQSLRRRPHTSRSLQRVVMDHTPSDLIIVDDNSMLPLGRPTITTALDEYTRCPMGFYAGFEPPSCLSA